MLLADEQLNDRYVVLNRCFSADAFRSAMEYGAYNIRGRDDTSFINYWSCLNFSAVIFLSDPRYVPHHSIFPIDVC